LNGVYDVRSFQRGRRRATYQERSQPPSYLIGIHLPVVVPNVQSPKFAARSEISQLLADECNNYIADNNLSLSGSKSDFLQKLVSDVWSPEFVDRIMGLMSPDELAEAAKTEGFNSYEAYISSFRHDAPTYLEVEE
jgi:hypothetical protein